VQLGETLHTWAAEIAAMWRFTKNGSAQESDRSRNLGRFPEDHEFGLRGGHPLGLQQQIPEVPISAATAKE